MKTAHRMPGRGLTAVVLVAALAGLTACGGSERGEEHDEERAETESDEGGLTAQQMENGIGPISTLEVGALDDALAATGEEAFTIKCSACHKMDERYVGPPLRDVTVRRAPAYVMNMMLNPEGMLAEHPEARALLAQYAVPMANQNLTQEEARAILEYLRSQATEEPGS